MARYSIDYGHCLSGSDTGAGGCGYREENMTREIGRLVVAKLRRLGHEVQEIDLQSANSLRESLNYRINKINSFAPDLSISIHINAGGGYGAESLTDGENISNEVSNRILAEFVAMGYRSRGIKDGIELAVVGGVNSKALLFECCFIDTQDDMNKYNPESFSNAIVKGITGQVVSNPTPLKTEWIQDKWGWWFRYSDGSYPKSNWLQLNNEWYYFNKDGYAVKNWQVISGVDYYFNSDCKMVTNKWIKGSYGWYYLLANGTLAKGWIKESDDAYYLNQATGLMASNTVVEGKKIGVDGSVIW